ncbi:MAG: Ig-like domain-containing protein [archaeon]|jgi:hypothetical protein
MNKSIISKLILGMFLIYFIGSVFAICPVTSSDVSITAPLAGNKWGGTQNVTWEILNGKDNTECMYSIYYTIDSENWVSIAMTGDNVTSYSWDTSSRDDGTNYKVGFFIDGAFNVMSGIFTIDNTLPTINSIVLGRDTFTATNNSTTITFTFSEAVTGFTTEDISVANGEISGFTVTGNPLIYTATFTADPNKKDAENTIIVGTDWNDLALNAPLAGLTSGNYTINTVRPTLEITLSDNALKIGDTSTATLTFSEEPTNFTIDDIITHENGTVGDFNNDTGDPLVFTVVFTPTADVEDAVNTITTGTDWTNAAGNPPAEGSTSPNYTIDTLRPTVGIVLADAALKVGETSLVTITFNEAVTGFDNDDITTIANGILTDVNTTDNIIWLATFEPTDDIEDTSNVITITKTGVADLAGNAGASTTSSGNYEIDTKEPILTITMDDNELNYGDTATVTFTFSEAPTGFATADVTVITGAIGTITDTNVLEQTAVLTPTSSRTVALNTVSVSRAWTDAAGNAPEAITYSANYSVDTMRPTPFFLNPPSSPTNDSPMSIKVSFSEGVTTFIEGDIDIVNGTIDESSFTAVSDATYDFNVTPTADGAVTFNIAADKAIDAAGNANTAATQLSIIYDGTAPDVTSIVLADTALKAGETSLVTITFTEAVTGFANADITTIDNGILTTVATSDNIVFTATFTPSINTDDNENVITITESGLTDLAGTAGVGTTSSANYAIDTLRPTLAITIADNDLIIGETTTATFTFSEVPTEFATADVTVGNGAIGAINATNPLIQTATLTPSSGIEDITNVISVATSWADPAGNVPAAVSASANYVVHTDVNAPTITITSDANDTTENSATISADINDLSGGTLDVWTIVSETGTSNMFVAPTRTYSAGTDIEYDINNLDANTDYNYTMYVRDIVGNLGNATGTFTTQASSDDTTEPTVSITVSDIFWDGVYINANIADDSNSLLEVWLEYTDGNNTSIESPIYMNEGSISMAIGGLTENTDYNITMYVRDSSGNVNNDTDSFKTDVNGPEDYAIDFPKSGSGFTSVFFGDLLAEFELEGMANWDENLVMDDFLNATTGPDEERLTSDLVNVVYVYNFVDNAWDTIDDVEDTNFSSYNMQDNFTSLNYVVFDLENEALHKSIRHMPVEEAE